MTIDYMTETGALEQRLTDSLATIRRLWPDMLPTSAPGRSPGGAKTTTITADDHATTGHDIDALTRLVSLRRQVTDTLNGWSRVVMEDRPVTTALPDGLSVPSMCAFLDRHARWMSGHEAADDMASEVEELARTIDRYLHPPARDWIVLGDCPFVIDGAIFCTGRVRWYDDANVDPYCTECGQQSVLEWWEDVLGVVSTVTYDGLRDFIRRQFGRDIKRPTIRTWLNRGVIESCGVDAQGRTLFDKGAVALALDRQRVA